MFNISEFLNNGLVLGGARPALFSVRFTTVPPGVPDATADLQFVCRASQFPESQIDPVQVSYFGRKINLAGDRTFQPWPITVMNDEDFRHRNMFEGWSNYINALVSNRQSSATSSLLDYKVTAEVMAYSKAGPGDDTGIVRAYTMTGVWPSSLDAITLDWEDTNTVSTFNCVLMYDYWTPAVLHADNPTWSGTISPDSVSGTIL